MVEKNGINFREALRLTIFAMLALGVAVGLNTLESKNRQTASGIEPASAHITWSGWSASAPRRNKAGLEEIEYRAVSNHPGFECRFYMTRKNDLSVWKKSEASLVGTGAAAAGKTPTPTMSDVSESELLESCKKHVGK